MPPEYFPVLMSVHDACVRMCVGYGVWEGTYHGRHVEVRNLWSNKSFLPYVGEEKEPQREGEQTHHGWSHPLAHLKRSESCKIRETTSPQRERKACWGITGKAVPGVITHMHTPHLPRRPLQLNPDAQELGLSVGEYLLFGFQSRGAAQTHTPTLARSRDWWRCHTCTVWISGQPPLPSHVNFLFTVPLHLQGPWLSTALYGEQIKYRKTLIFHKLLPCGESACSVPGVVGRHGKGDSIPRI